MKDIFSWQLSLTKNKVSELFDWSNCLIVLALSLSVWNTVKFQPSVYNRGQWDVCGCEILYVFVSLRQQ